MSELSSVNTAADLKLHFAAMRQILEQPPLLEGNFIDITPAVRETTVNPTLTDNSDLKRVITGWPDKIDPRPFCLFSIPPRSSMPEVSIRARTHIGMGRGISELNFPGVKPSNFLVRDEESGVIYTGLGTKGNGPTANEALRVTGQFPDADKRVSKKEPWGLVGDKTCREIEMATLNTLAGLQFRVGKVACYFTLDEEMLTDLAEPFYQKAGFGSVYDLRRELAKWQETGIHPAIQVRLGGGMRADVFANKLTPVDLLMPGFDALSREISGRGVNQFAHYYQVPNSLGRQLEVLADTQNGHLSAQSAEAYLATLAFIKWRDYFLEQEYNAKFPLSDEQLRIITKGAVTHSDEKFGLLWLNFKPGDWDTAGFGFDVDVFKVKLLTALRRGKESVLADDRQGIADGLDWIAAKLEHLLSGDSAQTVERSRQEASQVSGQIGFLNKNAPRELFYFHHMLQSGEPRP